MNENRLLSYLTKRLPVAVLVCLAASSLSFGATVQAIDTSDWNTIYNNSATALFTAVVQAGAAGNSFNLQSGAPNGSAGDPLDSIGLESFTLTYDPVTGDATLTVGANVIYAATLTKAPAGGTLDHVGFQLNASDGTVILDNLFLNGMALTGDALTDSDGVVDFAVTPVTNLAGGPFTLTGDISVDAGSASSAVSATIVGADTPMPEPGTFVMLSVAMIGFGLVRRKR